MTSLDRLFDVPCAPDTPADHLSDYGRISKAIELLLAAELMLRGHHVSIPLQDDGVDLIVDYRTLVQVKSGANRDSRGTLRIQLDGRRYRERSSRSRKGMIRSDIDVIACYSRDSGRWWFIPYRALEDSGAKTSIALTEHLPQSRTRAAQLSSYLDAWHVFENGAA